ncbi:MAG: hypothetical protein QOF40_1951 [Actinomycetota bacterium]|nr:hypothetical protein [Actinomycetota bacterium]
MATTKKTKKKARNSSGSKAKSGLSTKAKNRLPKTRFAFPKERKEPLTDAKHVRNAIARFDQVKGVTDAERDKAWKRIRRAAKKFGVDVRVKGWRELLSGGKSKKSSKKKAKKS